MDRYLASPFVLPLALLAIAEAAQAQQASLRVLARQADPRPYSWIDQVSDDGTVIAGQLHGRACFAGGSCFSTMLQAFRQEADGAIHPLPSLPPTGVEPISHATGLTGDGAMVVGGCTTASGPDGCRWKEGVAAPLGTGGAPLAVSSDGAALLLPEGVLRDGVLTPRPDPGPGMFFSQRGFSRDGRIVVGAVSAPLTFKSAASSVDGAVALLPDPPGLEGAEALGVSDDGRVVVGWAMEPASPFATHAVAWIDGIPRRLVEDEFYASSGRWGGPPQWGSSRAIDVSGDGRIVLVNLNSGSGVIEPMDAFLWDEANGLRKLTDVLASDFGLELLGRGEGPAGAISRDGRTVVGAGAGIARQGWVATIPDGCSNGVDDDGDGLIDLEDPGCRDATDYSERGPGPECDDGLDNDDDLFLDFPADPSCSSAQQAVEGDCTDGIDNDGDGLVDLEDPGCLDANDRDEQDARLPCDDGLDNDDDGLVDFRPEEWAGGDPSCASPWWPTETTVCSDGLDNDGDGLVDWWEDPGCNGLAWGWSESGRPPCGLGVELTPVLAALLAIRRTRRWH